MEQEFREITRPSKTDIDTTTELVKHQWRKRQTKAIRRYLRWHSILVLLVMIIFIILVVVQVVWDLYYADDQSLSRYPCLANSSAYWQPANGSTPIQRIADLGSSVPLPGPRFNYSYSFSNGLVGAHDMLSIVSIIFTLFVAGTGATLAGVLSIVSTVFNIASLVFTILYIVLLWVSYYLCNNEFMPWAPCVKLPHFYCVYGLSGGADNSTGICYPCYGDAYSFTPGNAAQLYYLVPDGFWFRMYSLFGLMLCQLLMLFISNFAQRAKRDYITQFKNPAKTVVKMIRKLNRLVTLYSLLCIVQLLVVGFGIEYILTKPTADDWTVVFASFSWVYLGVFMTIQLVPPFIVLFALGNPLQQTWWTLLSIIQPLVAMFNLANILWIIIQFAICYSSISSPACYFANPLSTDVSTPLVMLMIFSIVLTIIQLFHVLLPRSFKRIHSQISIKPTPTRVQYSATETAVEHLHNE